MFRLVRVGLVRSSAAKPPMIVNSGSEPNSGIVTANEIGSIVSHQLRPLLCGLVCAGSRLKMILVGALQLPDPFLPLLVSA